MEVTRREVIGIVAAFAAMAQQFDSVAFGQAASNAPTGDAVDVASYWSNFYNDIVITKGANKATLAAAKRKTLYLHSADSGKPLNYADTIPISSLPAIQGNASVNMAISQYRPGKGDVSLDVSHLRIDASQTFDYMNLIAPLSWAAIGSFTPDKDISKLPSIDQLGFKAQADDTSTGIKQLILPNGVGKFAVNVTRPTNKTFTQIIMSASVGISSALSMMTLPAISAPAAKIVTELFGKWESHATVIMNGNLTPVIATSTVTANIPMPQNPMALPSGYFVMFPEEHEPDLKSDFDNLTILNGFLVHKDAPASDDLLTRAKNAVPGVSYVSLRLNVEQSSGACSDKPNTGRV